MNLTKPKSIALKFRWNLIFPCSLYNRLLDTLRLIFCDANLITFVLILTCNLLLRVIAFTSLELSRGASVGLLLDYSKIDPFLYLCKRWPTNFDSFGQYQLLSSPAEYSSFLDLRSCSYPGPSIVTSVDGYRYVSSTSCSTSEDEILPIPRPSAYHRIFYALLFFLQLCSGKINLRNKTEIPRWSCTLSYSPRVT